MGDGVASGLGGGVGSAGGNDAFLGRTDWRRTGTARVVAFEVGTASTRSGAGVRALSRGARLGGGALARGSDFALDGGGVVGAVLDDAFREAVVLLSSRGADARGAWDGVEVCCLPAGRAVGRLRPERVDGLDGVAAGAGAGADRPCARAVITTSRGAARTDVRGWAGAERAASLVRLGVGGTVRARGATDLPRGTVARGGGLSIGSSSSRRGSRWG